MSDTKFSGAIVVQLFGDLNRLWSTFHIGNSSIQSTSSSSVHTINSSSVSKISSSSSSSMSRSTSTLGSSTISSSSRSLDCLCFSITSSSKLHMLNKKCSERRFSAPLAKQDVIGKIVLINLIIISESLFQRKSSILYIWRKSATGQRAAVPFFVKCKVLM